MRARVVLCDGFEPLDVIAPYEVLCAGGSASDGAVSVEPVSAEAPHGVVGGTGGMTPRATGALDPERADMPLVPGASGRVGEPGGTPDEEVGAGKRDEFLPVLLGRTPTAELPALLKKAWTPPTSPSPPPAAPGRPAVLTGIFNLLRATVTVLVARPGATTGA
jgi:hypothetical protein